ncbi:hypothetical protein BGZ57DRAFT_629492 [Hyaloscypha finlandica]|nr:hypothetical protein F5882DRAFT_411808 [Hyaloscypha sp. PMI_1271]KAH8791155.1 hypothetical protein BGZ57DRAFT_629492 [Hyaloscypha finlandica]
MPYNELQRRDSWPPTIIRLREEEEENLDNIDENPISFFLTSPEDIEEFLDDEDLSAGIETPESSHTPVREISPSTLQRVPLEADDDETFGLAMPMALKDFTAKHISGRKSRAGARPDELKGLGITINIPEFSATRGRPKVRLTPSRSGRGRGQTRSLSARRPQSWREPSPDIWTIREERESDDEVKMTVGRADTPVSMSAPASTNLGTMAMMTPSPKPKKRVHWAC